MLAFFRKTVENDSFPRFLTVLKAYDRGEISDVSDRLGIVSLTKFLSSMLI